MTDNGAPPPRPAERRPRVGITVIVALAAAVLGAAVAVRFSPPTIHGRRAYEPPVARAPEGDAPGQPVAAAAGTAYVPVYSHVYHKGGRAFLLEVTLSIRNTDRSEPITVTVVDYHDTQGRRLRSHLARPLRLAPLATAEFLVEEKEESGGSGASFLVEWSAAAAVSEPVIEAVMIGTAGGQGISFLSAGRAVARGGAAGLPAAPAATAPAGR